MAELLTLPHSQIKKSKQTLDYQNFKLCLSDQINFSNAQNDLVIKIQNYLKKRETDRLINNRQVEMDGFVFRIGVNKIDNVDDARQFLSDTQ